jgi:hypothetical protein
VLAALWWASRRRTPDDALALLALMLLVTGAGHAAFIGSLVAWEGLTRRGLPAVSLLTSAAMLAVPSAGWYLPVALWLAARLYLPARTFRRVRAWPAPATQ